ncbi:hypothetical protein Rs2_16630 [Raphanus sativus]|nr:hypothetical protein Rs2_16630 [Raphanus sativus]
MFIYVDLVSCSFPHQELCKGLSLGSLFFQRSFLAPVEEHCGSLCDIASDELIISSTDAFCLKTRKPYTITKQREKRTEAEHEKFVEALKLWQSLETNRMFLGIEALSRMSVDSRDLPLRLQHFCVSSSPRLTKRSKVKTDAAIEYAAAAESAGSLSASEVPVENQGPVSDRGSESGEACFK